MKKNIKGFALITSVLVVSVLIPLILACISRVTAEYRLTSKFYNSTAAFELAEAGAENAIWQINWGGLSIPNGTTYNYDILSSSLKASSGRAIGDISISIYCISSFNGNTYTATSTGFVPNKTSPDEKRTIVVQFTKNYNFSNAMVANGNITLNGQSIVDSYDSSLQDKNGNLAGYNGILPDGTQNKGTQGNVQTNGKFILNDTPPSGYKYIIGGDANPGPGNTIDPKYYSTISGSHTTLQAPIQLDDIPDATMASAKVSNNNNSIDPKILTPGTYNLNLNGSTTLTLAPGPYYFTSININGSAALKVSGPTTIYVQNGDMNINGQGIINSGQPRDLLVLSTGKNVNLNGQSDFTGALYAPNSLVTLNGQGEIYGSVVCGGEIENGRCGVHYDVNLAKVPPPGFGTFKIAYWQEIKK